MNWVQFAGSLAAILFVAALVRWMGLGRAPHIASEQIAMDHARQAHSGFDPVDALIDDHGKAAIVRDDAGRYIALKAHGAQIAARYFDGPPQMIPDETGLTIITGDRMFGDVRIANADEQISEWMAAMETLADG